MAESFVVRHDTTLLWKSRPGETGPDVFFATSGFSRAPKPVPLGLNVSQTAEIYVLALFSFGEMIPPVTSDSKRRNVSKPFAFSRSRLRANQVDEFKGRKSGVLRDRVNTGSSLQPVSQLFPCHLAQLV